MILTTEKAEKLTVYLTDDIDRAKKLFALPLSEAVKEISSDGLEYTEDELREYAEYIRTSLLGKNSEFNESKLDEISGGFSAKSGLIVFADMLSNGICGWIR